MEKYFKSTCIPHPGELMATTVKIESKDKAKLERLQALLTLKSGSKMTQQSILSMLINEALDKTDDFDGRATESDLPMRDEDYEKILSLIQDWGVETSWEDIDQVLYGSRKGARG